MGPLASIFRSAIAALVLSASLTAPAAGIARAGDAASEPAPPAVDPGVPIDPAGAPDPGSEIPRYRLEPIVVTPDRLPIRLDRVPSDVTVITAERLETRRPLALSDALRSVPGIDVQRSGTLGKLTDVRLRGADPRHTLVLFDGIPLNGPWLGSLDFADLMGTGFDQVEVFGGPASSLYGSGAVGGVIQGLSTPAEGAAKRSLFAEYGDKRTFRQGLTWSSPVGEARAGLALDRLTSEGQGPRDAYSGVNGQLRLEVPIGGERLRVSALATQGDKE